MYRGVRSGRRVSFVLELYTYSFVNCWCIFFGCLQLLKTTTLLQSLSCQLMAWSLVDIFHWFTFSTFNSCITHAVWLSFSGCWILTYLLIGFTLLIVEGKVRWQHVWDIHVNFVCARYVPYWVHWSLTHLRRLFCVMAAVIKDFLFCIKCILYPV